MNLNMTVGQAACQRLCRYAQSQCCHSVVTEKNYQIQRKREIAATLVFVYTQVTETLTDGQVTLQRFNSIQITLSCVIQDSIR